MLKTVCNDLEIQNLSSTNQTVIVTTVFFLPSSGKTTCCNMTIFFQNVGGGGGMKAKGGGVEWRSGTKLLLPILSSQLQSIPCWLLHLHFQHATFLL